MTYIRGVVLSDLDHKNPMPMFGLRPVFVTTFFTCVMRDGEEIVRSSHRRALSGQEWYEQTHPRVIYSGWPIVETRFITPTIVK